MSSSAAPGAPRRLLTARARGRFVFNIATLFSVFTRVSSAELRESSPSFDDAPKFNVQLLRGALRHPPPGSRAVIMTKKDGKRYRCHLPSTSTEDEQSSGTAAATSLTPRDCGALPW